MKIYSHAIVAAALMAAASPVVAATTVTFGGVFEVPTSGTNDHIFGTGGSVPFTIAISYNAPATPVHQMLTGEIYDPWPGFISANPSFVLGNDMYAYPESILTGVTLTTAHGSQTFTPGVDNFFTFSTGSYDPGWVWFDVDLATGVPTTAFFRVQSATANGDGKFTSLNLSLAEQAGPVMYYPGVASAWVTDTLEDSPTYEVGVGYTEFAPVPEPSSALLFGLAGTAGLLSRRRRG